MSESQKMSAEQAAETLKRMGIAIPVRPEISDTGRKELREKHRRNSPTHDRETYGMMSDEWVANNVRMLMRNDLDHEAIVVAARDRIMRLSLEVERLKEFEFMYNGLQK